MLIMQMAADEKLNDKLRSERFVCACAEKIEARKEKKKKLTIFNPPTDASTDDIGHSFSLVKSCKVNREFLIFIGTCTWRRCTREMKYRSTTMIKKIRHDTLPSMNYSPRT